MLLVTLLMEIQFRSKLCLGTVNMHIGVRRCDSTIYIATLELVYKAHLSTETTIPGPLGSLNRQVSLYRVC